MFLKKNTVLLILSAVSIIACNNKEDDTETKTEAVSPEKKLKEDIAIYPDSLLLTQKLIEYYSDNGNYDTALAITDKAISKNPDVVELWDIKATLYFQNGDTIAAIKSFEKAIDIFPLPKYIISLGTLYAQTKNPKGLILADALIGADKAKAAKEAIFIKGLYYNYINDKKKAIALYDQGKYEEALKVLTRAVTIQNNFDEGYYWLGNCYKKLNKKEEAIQSYHIALMYDKDFIEARDSLKILEGK